MAQHDYDIENSSFPSFRTNLNGVLSAINSSNSGSSRPSSAVAGTIWLDTSGAATAQLLKMYDGAADILLGTVNFTANTVDFADSASSVADDSITLAKMASGTDGNIISYDASGNPVAVATGSSGQVLTSAGVGAVPSFQTLTGNATHSGEVTGATALTIADNVVDEANLKVSNAPVNGYMLTAQSGNTGGMTWAEAGGGDMVKLSTSTISANTTAVTFNGLFSSTYKNYFIIGSSIRPDADTSVYMRFRESDSDVTASNYIWTQNTIRVQNSNGAMEEDNNSGKSAFFKLAPTVSISNDTDGNAAKRAYNFNFHLHDPLSTSYAKYFFGATASIYDNGSDTWFYNHHIAGTYSASTAALTGFTIYPSTGNFDAGTITLYGLKH